MKIIFIRHAQTAGNLKKQYIGKTDEPLCEAGIQAALNLLESGAVPSADRLISSPYRRCIQTAEILYPNRTFEICEDLRECNFGEFEGKTYEELCANPSYITWIENNCLSDIPNGDSMSEFKNRCCNAFSEAVNGRHEAATALVIHGGSIMAILERFARPEKPFHEYHLQNCGFIVCEYDGEFLTCQL